MLKNSLLAITLIILPICVLAASNSEAGLSAYKELNQAHIDALKESFQQQIQIQKVSIDAQDKKIDQQSKLLDSFSSRISDISLFLTVFGSLAAIVGYFTVQNRAQKEARVAAEEWMENVGQKAIVAKLKEFQSHIDDQKNLINEQTIAFGATLENFKENARDSITKQQNEIAVSQKLKDGSIVHKQASPSNGDPINQLVEALKQIPEAAYGFDDWNARAHDAYKNGNFSLAAEYWLQASRGGKATGLMLVQSLSNAAFALGLLNRDTEALDVYNQLISLYKNAPEISLREAVAKAYLSQSGVLLKLESYEKAIAVCEEIEALYGTAQEASLLKVVGDSNNHKGYALLCDAKKKWNETAIRISHLQYALTMFDKALSNSSDQFVVLGNKAYANFLLGHEEVAQELLEQAFHNNPRDEDLYEATLNDLKIHTVPLDKNFNDLLESIWEKHKPENLPA